MAVKGRGAQLKRIEALKQLFSTWRQCSFAELTERLPGYLNDEVMPGRRTLYRDLEFLVEQGFLTCSAPDDTEGDANENEKRVWALAESAGSITGEGFLTDLGFSLLASDAVADAVLVQPIVEASKQKDRIHLVFVSSVGLPALSIAVDDFPIAIVFHRKSDQPWAGADTIQSRRWLAIGIPNASVSLQGTANIPGHAVLKIDPRGNLTLEDLGSRNGTFTVSGSSAINTRGLGNGRTIQDLDLEAEFKKTVGVVDIKDPSLIRFGKTVVVEIFK